MDGNLTGVKIKLEFYSLTIYFITTGKTFELHVSLYIRFNTYNERVDL